MVGQMCNYASMVYLDSKLNLILFDQNIVLSIAALIIHYLNK